MQSSGRAFVAHEKILRFSETTPTIYLPCHISSILQTIYESTATPELHEQDGLLLHKPFQLQTNSWPS